MANPVLLGANNAPQAKSMMTALTGLVEDGGRVGQIHSDRKVFTPITANVQQSSAYNGYFKITDASEHDESGKITQTRVAIIDGGLGSSNMPCRVNNSVFYVPSKMIWKFPVMKQLSCSNLMLIQKHSAMKLRIPCQAIPKILFITKSAG